MNQSPAALRQLRADAVRRNDQRAVGLCDVLEAILNGWIKSASWSPANAPVDQGPVVPTQLTMRVLYDGLVVLRDIECDARVHATVYELEVGLNGSTQRVLVKLEDGEQTLWDTYSGLWWDEFYTLGFEVEVRRDALGTMWMKRTT